MKMVPRILISITLLLTIFLRLVPLFSSLNADTAPGIDPSTGVPYIVCGCPDKLEEYYKTRDPNPDSRERCVGTYDEFKEKPAIYHLWVEDPEITYQGKADERARQFLYWVLTHPSIDDHPTIRYIWVFTRNIAYFFVLLVAVIMGIGIIIAQRQNFTTKIEVSPLVIKLIVGLLYITFSGAIVLTIVQFSEILMKFFIENLGGKDLFNIYFTSVSTEDNYIRWFGCRDLNIRSQEAIRAEIFLLKATNITYYVMAVMLLLRKILLWFLLFVSPFVAILMPFVFIRNIAWIWIGVFFQWVFYGPLFALFLGALAQIWRNGIPFPFNFSRTNSFEGYIYPTAMNITYGGPAQEWNAAAGKQNYTNNGNYVDTFAEYIITLLMLWAVTFFPWWLLRIFRDYCCDGIYAMKNILLSMYDEMRGGPSPKGHGPIPTSPVTSTGTAMKMPEKIEVPTSVKLETLQEIKKTRTVEISRSLNLSVSKLTDIARFETNKQTNEVVRKNINFLSNPMKAETPTERQKFMNIRTELFNRSVKQDTVAKTILSATSTSRLEQIERKQEILKSTPQAVPITHIISIKIKMPKEKVSAINTSVVNSVATNTNIVNSISQSTQVSASQVQTILTSFTHHINKPTSQIVENIVKETTIEKQKVTQVIKQAASLLSTSYDTIVTNLSQTTHLPVQQIKNVLNSYQKHVTETPAVIVENIVRETGIEKEKVNTVIKEQQHAVTIRKEIFKQVAQQHQVKEEDVQKLVQAQVPLITEPEKHVEETIGIPPSVSLEDYEEVKKMWFEQYEKGEVPVTENITSREQWVDQDTVFISNALNKLLSSDEQLKNQGLDDLGYILPIFMINNLKGEELLVYLKAKLEAAKGVKTEMEKEREITAQLKEKTEEQFVDVEMPAKKEAEKFMFTQDSLKQTIPQEPEIIGEDSITSSSHLNLSALKLADLVHFDSEEKRNKLITKTLAYIQDPQQAQTPEERQKYSQIRGELVNKAENEQDALSKNILTTVSLSSEEKRQKKEKLLESAPHYKTLVEVFSEKTKISPEKITLVVSSLISSAANTSSFVDKNVQATHLPGQKVENVLRELGKSASLKQSTIDTVDTLAQQLNIDKSQVNLIIKQFANDLLLDKKSVIAQISQSSQIPPAQVALILNSYESHKTEAPPSIVESIVRETKIERNKAKSVLDSRAKIFSPVNTLVHQVSLQTQVDENEVEKITKDYLAFFKRPEDYFEEIISIPPAISLEDYEEVKKMWFEQYEKGEVPVTENITSREQWVDQDTVFIVNTLNKLLSPNERLKSEGLEELEYLLPIFIINEFNLTDIIVYLKAKLEAVKEVGNSLSSKREEGQEEFVDLPLPKPGPPDQKKEVT